LAKLLKRALDALQPKADRDLFAWDSELRGFGVRVKPSGVKTFLIQYRNAEGRTRRLVLGQYGAVTPAAARDIARQRLTEVAQGKDPSAERHAVRAGVTLGEVCDWYLEQADAGRILGRKRRPIKASTLAMDRSRIETHIKPLLGGRKVSGLTHVDIEGMQADIVAGKSAHGRKGRGGIATGGAGAASRTVGTPRSLLGHAVRLKIIASNPAEGVRQLAGKRRQRRLSDHELRQLGKAMREAEAEGEHPTGLASIRLMLLTGFRKMEALALEAQWVSQTEQFVRFPDTKGGAQMRTIGRAAITGIEARLANDASRFVFPADWRDGHFVGVVRVLDRICRRAKLEGVTPHVLRHTFASVAGDLSFSELTIAGLIGHSARGVTQGYVHLDGALVVAADRVAAEIARLLDGGSARYASSEVAA